MSQSTSVRPSLKQSRRPQISREFLEAARRRSFAGATAELADEFGIWNTSVTLICQVARSSRATFYELFEGGEDCMRHAAAEGYELLFSAIGSASAEEGPWERRVAEATGALFAAAAADPPLARFLLVHARALRTDPGTPDAEAGIDALATVLASRDGSDSIPGPREDYVARIYVALLARRLMAGEEQAILTLPSELDAWALELLVPPQGARAR